MSLTSPEDTHSDFCFPCVPSLLVLFAEMFHLSHSWIVLGSAPELGPLGDEHPGSLYG